VPVSTQPYVIEVKSKIEHIRVNRFMSKKNKDTGRFEEIDNKSVSSDEHPSLFVKCRYDGKDFSLVFFTTIRNFSRRVLTYVEEAMDHIYNGITAPETYLDDNGDEVKLYINLSDVIRDSINQPLHAPRQQTQEQDVSYKAAPNAFDALDVEDPDSQTRALAEPKPNGRQKKGSELKYKPLAPRPQDLKPVIDSGSMEAFPTLGSKLSTEAKQLEQRTVLAYSKIAAQPASAPTELTIPNRNANRKVASEKDEYYEEDEYLPMPAKSTLDYFDADF
jgi:hypothetical protein